MELHFKQHFEKFSNEVTVQLYTESNPKYEYT